MSFVLTKPYPIIKRLADGLHSELICDIKYIADITSLAICSRGCNCRVLVCAIVHSLLDSVTLCDIVNGLGMCLPSWDFLFYMVLKLLCQWLFQCICYTL